MFRKGWRSLGGVAALLVGCALIAYFAWERALASEVQRQLDQLQARGEPISYDDLEVLANEGGVQALEVGRLWLAAVAPLTTSEYQERVAYVPIVGSEATSDDLPLPGQPWPELEEVEIVLAQYEQAMSTLHLAGEQGPTANFDLDYRDLGINELDHVTELREGARMLVLEAYARAHRGDVRGTVASLCTMMRLSRSLEHEPLCVSTLVRFALAGIAMGTLEELLPHVDFGDEDLLTLQSALRELEFRQAVRTALMAERAIGVELIRDPARLEKLNGKPVYGLSPSHDDILLLLVTYQGVIDELGVSWQRGLAVADAAGEDLVAASASRWNRWRHARALACMMAPRTFVEIAANGEAHRNLLDAALALERNRLVNGNVPETLEELVPGQLPAVPLDPFSGMPIRFLVEDEEVVLYSIGQDRVDDEGHMDEEEVNGPDIAIRVPHQ